MGEPTLETAEESTELSTVDRIVGGQIDRQIATARAYPRSLTVFKKKAMEMATLDEETAESCFYALPRSGKTIEGPSARLGEIVASAWGHLRIEARVVAIEEKFVVALGTAWDMQNNTAYSYEVRRRITDKSGRRYNEDMQTVTSNAACSIAARNATLKVVPPSYWKPIYEQCIEMVKGDLKTLADRRAAALDHFQKLGVPNAKVFAMLEVNGEDDVTLDHLVTLKGLATALKEGDTTLDQAFPKPEVVMPGKKSEKKDDSQKVTETAQGGQPEAGENRQRNNSDASKIPDNSSGSGQAGEPKKDTAGKADKKAKPDSLEELRKFVEGPIETIRDTPHEVFLTMCKGLKGDEFNGLLIKYNDRKKEVGE